MTYTHGTLGGDRGKTVPDHERMEKEIRQIRKRIASKPRDEDLKRLGVLEAVKGAESDEDPSEAVAADQRRPVPRGKGMRAVRKRVCYGSFQQLPAARNAPKPGRTRQPMADCTPGKGRAFSVVDIVQDAQIHVPRITHVRSCLK